MEGGDGGSDLDLALNAVSQSPLSCVSLSAFSSPRSSSGRGLRLSSCTSEVSRAVPAPRRKLAWVSLQGRLVDAEEASSTRTIGGGLSPEETVAWELFSPLQRVLVVAIVAAASAGGTKSRQILQLQKSVDIRVGIISGYYHNWIKSLGFILSSNYGGISTVNGFAFALMQAFSSFALRVYEGFALRVSKWVLLCHFVTSYHLFL